MIPMYKWITNSVVMAENEHGSNIFCVALSDELVFIDAGMLNGYTSKFKESMEVYYGLKASTLFITHAHIDHILAMNAFSDCEIIAAEAAKPRFETQMATDFNEERLSRMENNFPYIREGIREGEFLEPTKWIESEYESRSIVFKVHGGHSACSSSIHIPGENCVALGDLVQSERPPYFGEPDTDIENWIKPLEAWKGSDIAHVLPGHGPVIAKSYLGGVSSYFRDFKEMLCSLKAENTPAEGIHLNEALPSGYWPQGSPKSPAHYFSIKQSSIPIYRGKTAGFLPPQPLEVSGVYLPQA